MTAPQASSDRDPFVVIVLSVATILGSATILGWVALQLGGLVTQGRPVPVAFGDTLKAVNNLRRHHVSPGMPSWPMWCAIETVLVVGLLFGTWKVWRWWHTHHPAEPTGGFGTARDLQPLRVPVVTPGRITLGTIGRTIVAAETHASVAVIGPTGCGKTVGLAIPALTEWPGPVLATSVKTDLVDATINSRTQRGEVAVFDPTQTSNHPSSMWTPLSLCSTWAGALDTAGWLCDAAKADIDSGTEHGYWKGQATTTIAPYLYAAALDQRSMHDVVDWIDRGEQRQLERIFGAAATPHGQPATELAASIAAAKFGGFWQREPRGRDPILATCQNVVAAYADPRLDTTNQPAIDFDRWLAQPNTLYVIAPGHEQTRLRSLFCMLVASAIRHAYTVAAANDGHLDRPCLILLDEAAHIAPLADLPALAATARSHHISVMSVWQDLAQLDDIYGLRSRTVLNNHRAKLFAGGISDNPTLELLSRLIGQTAWVERNHTFSDGRRSVSEHTRYLPAAPPEQIRQLPAGHAILIYGSLPPARVHLRPLPADSDAGQP